MIPVQRSEVSQSYSFETRSVLLYSQFLAHDAPSLSPQHPLLIAQTPPDPRTTEEGKNLRVAIFLIISIVTSSLSLGIAFGIRKRIDQIGGLDEEED